MQIYNPGPGCKYFHESNYSEKSGINSEKLHFHFSRNPIFVFLKSLSEICVAVLVGMAGGLEGHCCTRAKIPQPPSVLCAGCWDSSYGVQCAVCSVQCAVCSVQRAMCSVQCTVLG